MARATGRTVAVLAAAGALVLGTTTGASAATGTFVYHTQPGNVAHTLTDPSESRCYPVGRGAQGRVDNNTDRRAVLYAEKNCRNATAEELEPGQWVADAVFMSVKFTP
ncbi:hypothetical protein ABZ714_29505 [Streptomyces sp. NPDC006798]|uniref:hypothetical protein n=1 Tax=Streptomyces sp. NPDC006798 TaxID=3155462 RepID=UPI0033D92958